ncbi:MULTISPECIES: diaminopimelate epimerase [Fervidobacterium]|uniref:Diaminopimelate epimerase n=1 Tax=Fervidobacterium nodosum (strain ATCC 35602 / DSM 5306 / Rt17-B1) TaxID=381764 RepID=A7HJ55_FERNB|nr:MULTISPECIES: diaminopimelate epimerase [Fervidobacterium]ABS59938.1 Diaminopimelate epimerase [Fervidobacterium nodosum Rt17-B1]KAF2961784.1 diaminopimelate epimerase [Fervidobacterium sp. 2310opik-2]PHJ12538.1 diaminopimelate epimerase [Fervidobacterium sp. SC_NGM5_G05]HOJ93988.1 diaminopimelate epimerase [Fervidobacterium nodosum]
MDKKLKIYKYNANGNTFILIDCLDNTLDDSEKSEIVLKSVENRDGAIFVERNNNLFHMDYFNRDGKRAAFCGNGARTFVNYLKEYYGLSGEVLFSTTSGMLKALVDEDVSVQMPNPKYVKQISYESFQGALIETGVPHIVIRVENVDFIDIENVAPEIRRIFDANVNFYDVVQEKFLRVRTFERGVERETKSCGSGITSTSFYYKYYILKDGKQPDEIKVLSLGGVLHVLFKENEVYLEGRVEHE